ncbi:uncharacterized protein LOC141628499 [Silene latifolia]|uniref:uncharacterized protein LOC141628499 n=1 Tax=Silene latifolia TaxID=37657 RepID=UPI003D783BA9
MEMKTERDGQGGMDDDICVAVLASCKGQALADFLANHPVAVKWELHDDLLGAKIFYVDVLPPWQMYFDGAERRDGAGTGVVILSLEGYVFPCSFVLIELCSKNVSEYEALNLGLQIAIEIGIKDLDIYGDSLLVVNQVLDEFEVKKDNLIPYHQYAVQLLNKLDCVHIGHVSRSAIKLADALANLATTLALEVEEVTTIPVCNRWVVPPPEGGEIA